MPRLGVLRLTGKSGNRYRFHAYPLATVFRKGLAGVYVVTRRVRSADTGAARHKEFSLGQTGDLRQLLDASHAQWAAKANCICVLGEKDEIARRDIREDLADRPRRGQQDPDVP